MTYAPYDSRQIANSLIKISNERGLPMSIMRVLKLSYMTHGWALAIINEPLVNDYVQAWRYGPVIPSIYYSFRPHGVYDLKPIPLVREIDIDEATNKLIAIVYALYEDLSANQLSALTHIKGGPWHTKYEHGKRGVIIPNEMIAEHFKNKLERSRNSDDAS